MPFQIVCVQFHEARQHVIAPTVYGSGRYRGAFPDVTDLPVLQVHAAGQQAVVQNKPCVGETERVTFLIIRSVC